jgi:hypothetical protein
MPEGANEAVLSAVLNAICASKQRLCTTIASKQCAGAILQAYWSE